MLFYKVLKEMAFEWAFLPKMRKSFDNQIRYLMKADKTSNLQDFKLMGVIVVEFNRNHENDEIEETKALE
jgi:hypothetical protein